MEVRILIVTPQVGHVATGNRCSADQLLALLGGLGHDVESCGAEEKFQGGEFDLLVTLNAKKTIGAQEAFRKVNPEGQIIVVLTGTDIYPKAGEMALSSMRQADRLVALQSKALEQVPDEMRGKTKVIVQASVSVESNKETEFFDVAVVGHFRAVKDPLRTAEAVSSLPSESKVRVRQAGAILEDRYEELVRQEVAGNSRYEYLGEVTPGEALELIASSDLLVLTSVSEGAGRVIGEAVVCGTPVLSTRIDGVVGLLGDEYPGYFPVGDTVALAGLIAQAEGNEVFYRELKEWCVRVAPMFSPESERRAWGEMLDELINK